ncbi:MAG: hypothetical protein P9L92_02475 [Candidatus Electryonea clarkiae]|nr:hypothetical protein [Candidatus Electryonea clarkiae]MDP8285868.1 hypothetical protein [Candidatus Electryonea clarkiae]
MKFTADISHRKTIKCNLIVTAILLFALSASAYTNVLPLEEQSGPVRPEYTTHLDEMQIENRLHDVGNMCLTITNFGYFGNDSPTSGREFLVDPCTGEWSPQAEFPCGSGAQYLFQAGLWIGALIKEEGFEYPRVSHGVEGWTGGERGQEFLPGFTPGNGIVERSNRANAINCLGEFVTSDLAISEQDFISTYSDTSKVDAVGRTLQTGRDGAHVPLGVKVTQKSYAWSYNYAQDFIIIDYEFENIADKFLKNLYIGLYVDGDCGLVGISNAHTDDITGFTKTFEYEPPGSNESISLTINTAWIADNDGRTPTNGAGADFSVPDVTGIRVVRAPNPKLRTSFNWWISNGDADLDFGPSWKDDGSPGSWTETLGTPEDDERKYFVLKNREFDYDQIWVDDGDYIIGNPQEFKSRFDPDAPDPETHEWRVPGVDDTTPPEYPRNIADGFDTRYLLSWGPLGIFDYVDDAGNRIYRLNPGEKFSMTIAYVGGSNFHDRNHPQPTPTNLDPELFDFSDLQYNADWAAKVYDNPMIDTDGDGWFGEDTGIDGIFADTIGKTVSYINIDGALFTATYEGPDEGEQNGLLEPEEDGNINRPAMVDYTYNNELFDHGDGVPDFQGPPPPPTPILEYRTTENRLILVWDKLPSEDPDYQDPFSRYQDFEGYRIYVSNTGLENEFSFIAEFDYVDYAFYSDRDSLMSKPVVTDNPEDLPSEYTDRLGVTGYRKAVGSNIGLDAIKLNENTYEYDLGRVNPMTPRYYSVTAYDYGDPQSGTEPLETAKSANMIYMAPSGSKNKKPMVVPNPYRADQDYTNQHMQLIFDIDTTSVSWENRNDGTGQFFPQTDRRIYFYNIPIKCLIRIFTVSGDLVQIVDHNVHGNRISTWNSDYAEVWDLNSRNQQQVVSGLYLFSVEDYTDANKGNVDVGKFVVIR